MFNLNNHAMKRNKYSASSPVEQLRNDLQQERSEINVRLENPEGYRFPHERTTDAKRLREIKAQLNKLYLSTRGLSLVYL
jgi:hypothetical protein